MDQVDKYMDLWESHPVRGAWIEIHITAGLRSNSMSHPVRGAWIEMNTASIDAQMLFWSHPVRGAWIEIRTS